MRHNAFARMEGWWLIRVRRVSQTCTAAADHLPAASLRPAHGPPGLMQLSRVVFFDLNPQLAPRTRSKTRNVQKNRKRREPAFSIIQTSEDRGGVCHFRRDTPESITE